MIVDYQVLFDKIEAESVRFQQAQSFRVFHGRGRCYEGMEFFALDYFAPVLLLTVYRRPPDDFIESVSRFIQEKVLSERVSSLVLQRRDLKLYQLEELLGKMPESFVARRQTQCFGLQRNQQNVGYFLDIEPARCWLEEQVAGKTVLNMFAFTCSFSVVAVAGGARSVVNIDMSRGALNQGRTNHHLNSLTTEKVEFLAHDILRSWGKLIRKGPYEVIIVDPPSMQRGSFVASKDYVKIVNKLPALMCEGGYALLCLNAPEVSVRDFQELIGGCNQPLVLQQVLSANPDFPDRIESSLKMLVYRLDTGLSLPPL